MSSLRGLVKKISISGSRVDPLLIEQDKVKWQEERMNLLMSRQIPKEDESEFGLFPPRKTPDDLGPPVPVPDMSSIRLTALKWQKFRDENIIPELNLFCQTFCKGKPHAYVGFDSTKAYEDAISYGEEDRNGLRTKMILIDWEDIPEEIDCVFIGVLFPKNSAALLRGDTWFSATGMLEMLPLDEIDERNWMRDYNSWPQWDKDQKKRAELAEKDLFKKEPEFFIKNSVYSTYLCDRELGFTQSYLWGKCFRGEEGWEFQAIREAIDASSIEGSMATMRGLLPESYYVLGALEKQTLKLRTQDPLSKIYVDCIRYDRFGFRIGDIVTVGQQKRGNLDLDLEDLVVDSMTSLWLVWTGNSSSFVTMQIGEESAIEFMGTEDCIMAKLTNLGVSHSSSFPTPKPGKWISLPLFRALDGLPVEKIIAEYQPRAGGIRIHIENGHDLGGPKSSSVSSFATIKYGTKYEKSNVKKRTKNPVWEFSQTFALGEDWRENGEIEFHVFGKGVTGKNPLGMAVFELGSMRIPFSGPLRLRPTGPHATSKNIGGHIVVLVDVSPEEHENNSEAKEENSTEL